MFHRPLRVAPATIALAVLSVAGAASADEARVRYAISYLGLPVAGAALKVATDAGGYRAVLDYRTSGLVRIVSRTKGHAEVSGALVAGRVVPASFTLKSDEGKESMDVAIATTNGQAQALRALPPVKQQSERVPVLPAQLKDALDPLSALLAPVAAGADPLAPAACARTVPVFDGWSRYDIVLSPAGTTKLKIKGYDGNGLVCAARWVPVAGHRPNAKTTKFMADNKDLQLTLMPTKLGVLVPAVVSVRTQQGTVVITADRLGQSAADAAESDD